MVIASPPAVASPMNDKQPTNHPNTHDTDTNYHYSNHDEKQTLDHNENKQPQRSDNTDTRPDGRIPGTINADPHLTSTIWQEPSPTLPYHAKAEKGFLRNQQITKNK